jgi:hypothetical protein
MLTKRLYKWVLYKLNKLTEMTVRDRAFLANTMLNTNDTQNIRLFGKERKDFIPTHP